jgi:hypothetical protein
MGPSHLTIKLAAAPLVFLVFPGLWPQDPSKAADTAAIKQVFSDFYESFSRQDAHGTAMTFAEDGDFTNMFGICVHGREAIEQRFEAHFKGNMRVLPGASRQLAVCYRVAVERGNSRRLRLTCLSDRKCENGQQDKT